MSETASSKGPSIPLPTFPTHNSPRVWFLTSALSPLAVRLMRLLLAHGDYIAAGLPPGEVGDEDRSSEYRELIKECKDKEGWKDRIRGIKCDGRVMSNAQAALAEAIETFGRIDILLCNTSEAVVGTVEELSTSPATLDLVRRQFEVIFFGHVNFIKAILPLLRAKHNGHIILLSGIYGHIGTPGMPMYCAATWALEGYCDSLAYEVAPFNIKMTIVQPSKEINVLTNKVIFAPQLEQYETRNNPAPGLRDILSSVVNYGQEMTVEEEQAGSNKNTIISRFPRLPSDARDRLVMETVHALTAIGGHENPPARHIVGQEGVIAVKGMPPLPLYFSIYERPFLIQAEKIKTVSEELEDFVEVSLSADIAKTETDPAYAGLNIPGMMGSGGGL